MCRANHAKEPHDHKARHPGKSPRAKSRWLNSKDALAAARAWLATAVLFAPGERTTSISWAEQADDAPDLGHAQPHRPATAETSPGDMLAGGQRGTSRTRQLPLATFQDNRPQHGSRHVRGVDDPAKFSRSRDYRRGARTVRGISRKYHFRVMGCSGIPKKANTGALFPRQG